MSTPDFAAILSRITAGFHGQQMPHVQADALLAAKVPELCRTCGGDGLVPQCHPEHDAQGEDCGCPANFMPCPDCPTIATLLAIGAAVMTARMLRDSQRYRTECLGRRDAYSDDLLARLQSVEP